MRERTPVFAYSVLIQRLAYFLSSLLNMSCAVWMLIESPALESRKGDPPVWTVACSVQPSFVRWALEFGGTKLVYFEVEWLCTLHVLARASHVGHLPTWQVLRMPSWRASWCPCTHCGTQQDCYCKGRKRAFCYTTGNYNAAIDGLGRPLPVHCAAVGLPGVGAIQRGWYCSINSVNALRPNMHAYMVCVRF
jgi:hypothetical protein